MKLKNIISISLCVVLFVCGCSNNKTFDAKIGEIQDLKVVDKKVPKFVIDLKGLYDGQITEEDLEGLKMYDFIADVTAYDIDPDSVVYHENWSGYKLTDVLAAKEISDYDSIDFKSVGGLTVRYKKEEVSDKMYLIFYRNDKLLSESEETPVMLFTADLKNRYWVPSLTRIDIM